MTTGTAGFGDSTAPLVHSGNCTNDAIGGVTPYLHQNPLGVTYDPGAFLEKASGGVVDDLNVDQLDAKPFIVDFPFDYTQTDNTGGNEHVVVTAKLTISLA